MSFILDALDRSRRERDAELDGSPLSPAADATGAHARAMPWVTLLSLVLVAALAVITWLWLARATATSPAAEPSVAAVPAPGASTRGASTPQMAVPRRAGAPAPGTPLAVSAKSAPSADVSRLYGEARAAQAASSRQSGIGATVQGVAEQGVAEQGAAEPESLQADSSERAGADEPPRSESSDSAGEMPVDSMVARAEAAMDNRQLAAHPAPMLEELSQAVRDDIPTLIYSQHDYRASGGESSVLINRERRGVGDSTAGVRVREILPDSVVLSYRDTVFRLRALNSWVNL